MSNSAPVKMSAASGVTWPEGMGRLAVRVTRASYS